MSKADLDIAKFRGTYSPDVEIDEQGKLRWARDVAKGEAVAIPLHMLDKVQRATF